MFSKYMQDLSINDYWVHNLTPLQLEQGVWARFYSIWVQTVWPFLGSKLGIQKGVTIKALTSDNRCKEEFIKLVQSRWNQLRGSWNHSKKKCKDEEIIEKEIINVEEDDMIEF